MVFLPANLNYLDRLKVENQSIFSDAKAEAKPITYYVQLRLQQGE